MAQGYNARLDESLGMSDGKESTKKQTYRDRRDESKGGEKAAGKRAYSSNKSSAQGKTHSHGEAHGGHASVHKALQHSRKNRGRFSSESAELKYMPVIDREKDAMKAGDK